MDTKAALQSLGRVFRAVLDRLDSDKDRGTGPLETCEGCGRERRDISYDGLCLSCDKTVY